MIDWEWIKSLNIFNGCVGQLLGIGGTILTFLGTYYISNKNSRKQAIIEKNKSLSYLNIIKNEIIYNNHTIRNRLKTEKNIYMLKDEYFNKYLTEISYYRNQVFDNIMAYYIEMNIINKHYWVSDFDSKDDPEVTKKKSLRNIEIEYVIVLQKKEI